MIIDKSLDHNFTRKIGLLGSSADKLLPTAAGYIVTVDDRQHNVRSSLHSGFAKDDLCAKFRMATVWPQHPGSAGLALRRLSAGRQPGWLRRGYLRMSCTCTNLICAAHPASVDPACCFRLVASPKLPSPKCRGPGRKHPTSQLNDNRRSVGCWYKHTQ